MFANGAVTAAFARAFGEAAVSGRGGASSMECDRAGCYDVAAMQRAMDTSPRVAFDLPTLPPWLVDFSAGLGDGLTLTATRYARETLDIGGSVDPTSDAYTYGGWTSIGAGGARLAYSGIAKGYSVLAPSGAAASAFRETIKGPFRFFLGKTWRQPNLSRYSTDEALRAAAGRTNPYINAYGAGVIYSGAVQTCPAAEGC
jgi:hypothetical protein